VRWSGGPAWRILRACCVLDIARSAIVLGAPRGFRSSKPGAIHAPRIGMAPVRRFEDFDCWKLANELKLAVYELVQRAHVKPDREFCDQIRSAVASAPANIAEAFGRRSALRRESGSGAELLRQDHRAFGPDPRTGPRTVAPSPLRTASGVTLPPSSAEPPASQDSPAPFAEAFGPAHCRAR